ncbi:MAG: hypothetical protein AB7P99_13880 [Vicinamibacterales bacterium]
MTPFELSISVPADRRFGETIGALAHEAARQAGQDEAAAGRFGAEAEAALNECLAGGDRADGQVAILFRHSGGALDLTMTGPSGVKVARTLRIDV